MTLFFAIVLFVLGFIVFQWFISMASQPAFNRPLIFSKNSSVLIIVGIWASLLGTSFYLFWQFAPIIVIGIVFIFGLIVTNGIYQSRDKVKAIRLFNIYRQLKIYRIGASEHEVLKETCTTYLQRGGMNERRILGLDEFIFKDEIKDVKDFANRVLLHEDPSEMDLGARNFDKLMKKWAKRREAIDSAYKKVFEKVITPTEKPKLSTQTLERLKSLGLNAEAMSNEQLAALESMENISKNPWYIKAFFYVTLFCGFKIITSLIRVDFVSVAVYALIGFTFMFIGYKIQTKRGSRIFFEASIQNYAKQKADA